MTVKRDLSEVTGLLSEEEVERTLLDLTGDLDKARVLRSTLAPWLVEARPHTLAALQRAHQDSRGPRERVRGHLNLLQPLDRFCVDTLQAFLRRKGVAGVEVERDQLELPRRSFSGTFPELGGPLKQTVTLHKQSLVNAAMQNFSDTQAAPGGMSLMARIVSAKTRQALPGLTVEAFVGYCRELDLGRAYQAHIRQVFNLPGSDDAGEGALSYNAVAVDIGQSRTLDMQIDLHIALAKEHIGEATHARLLKLIRADRPAREDQALSGSEKPLIWQGLNLGGACLWSVLVVSEDAPGSLAAKSLVVYMPNEPVRPWYEYESLDDLTRYLSQKLQVDSYRQRFAHYLDESERQAFFDDFDKRRTVGPWAAVPVHSHFSDFFFRAYVGKAQLDARLLVVPTAQVDEDARRQRFEDYLSAGLDLLNIAGFVVPVLGQLMMGVAIGQMLGEVFDGVQDWSHHDTDAALTHLVNVAESIASLVAFAAAGRVVGALKRSLTHSSAFFDTLHPVRLADHSPRLWLPRLDAYRQPAGMADDWVASARGVFQAKGQSYIKIDEALYAIGFDPGIGKWRIHHPQRPAAFRPPLEHNFQGGWQHAFERPQAWGSSLYQLNRLHPALAHLPPDDVINISTITQLEHPAVQRLAIEHAPLPERFHDAVARFRQHQKITDLLRCLESGAPMDAATARTQLSALPLLPGWPQGRFFEVLDSRGDLLESHPDLSPFDYEDLSIHITQQQLNDGEAMPTLLQALNAEERTALLGETVEPHEQVATLERRLLATLKQHYRTLHGQLYRAYDGPATGELAPLVTRFPGLPRRVAWELLSQASALERQLLRNTGRVPLRLAEKSRQALQTLEQDHALMGFYWPRLAGEATHRLAIGMLDRLSGWPQDLLLQVRKQSLGGRLMGQVGAPTASVSNSVVSTAHGFQAFDAKGAELGRMASGPEGFYQALTDSLSAQQRINMNLNGGDGATRLRNQLRFKSQDERPQTAGYPWRERGTPTARPTPCALSQVAPIVEYPQALVRKVKTLYPSLDDLQISTLLRDAGTDHLSRAKAVEALEQQFKALHQALKIWRSEAPPSAFRASPAWDYRLSRHQAATLIEQAWKRLSVAPDELNVAVPSLVLDAHVLGKLPTLPAQVRFDHVQRLSLRNLALDDDAAYFLKHFKGLHTLNMAENQLTRLPDVLRQMLELERLYLAGNRLQLTEFTRSTLAGLRTLKTLNLSDNPLLDPPDVSRLFDLRELFLRNCRLTELPVGVQRLPYLDNVDLRENDIAYLPDWLFRMPRRFTEVINLRLNALSAASYLAVKTYRREHGIGMGVIEDDIARLTEQRARELWLADERVGDYQQRSNLWNGLRDEPGADGLFKLLAELGGTADARHVREDLDRRVWRVLERAAADAELREEIFQRAATPLHCDDAAATSFSSLEILVEINDVARLVEGGQATAQPLLKLAKGLFRLEQLERIARRHSGDNPLADPLEVSLAFRTGLVDRFHLPGQPSHMRFARLGGVTPEALTLAEAQVKVAELSPDLLKYLVGLPFWTDYLKRSFAGRFDAINTPFDQRMNEVFDQGLTLEDADYRDQMHAILDEQRAAEAAELERLSESVMKTEDLGLCEILQA